MPSGVYQADDVEIFHPAFAIPRPIAMGALWGVIAWSAYGLLEFFLSAVYPMMTRPSAVFTIQNWQINALLFDCYWAFGAVSGAIVGALTGKWSRNAAATEHGQDLRRLPGALSLVAGLILNVLTSSPFGRAGVVLLSICVVLAAAMVWSLRNPESRLVRWVDFHPLTLGAFLLGPTWLTGELLETATLWIKVGCVLLLVGSLLAVNAIYAGWRRWPARWHFAAYLASLTVLILVCAAVSGRHKARTSIATPAVPDPHGSPVILVSLDTTRADHLSTYGYHRLTSRNLTEFSRGATLFTDAMAASDMTLASHASVFTGVYPSWHGAHPYSLDPPIMRPLDGKLPTLAGLLNAKGYVTAGIAANSVFLMTRWGLNRGFEVFDVQSSLEILTFDRRFNMRHGIRRFLDFFMDTAPFDARFRRSDEINEETFGLLGDASVHGRSLFLFVNYMDSHAPYVPPRPFDRMFLGGSKPVSYPRHRVLERELMENGAVAMDATEQKRLAAQYDGGLVFQDESFGHLVAELKRRDLYDNALIIVTGDHGEAFGEHGMMEHGVGVTQDQVHVPLVIKFPHQTEAAVISTPVSHVDLLPTVLDTLGYAIPAHAQGRSLRNPAGLETRNIFAESFPNQAFGPSCKELNRTERTVRSGARKLIVSSLGTRRLFNLADDQMENHNLRVPGGPDAQDLEALLRSWVRSAPAATAPAIGRNDAEMNRLRGLGYVQ